MLRSLKAGVLNSYKVRELVNREAWVQSFILNETYLTLYASTLLDLCDEEWLDPVWAELSSRCHVLLMDNTVPDEEMMHRSARKLWYHLLEKCPGKECGLHGNGGSQA